MATALGVCIVSVALTAVNWLDLHVLGLHHGVDFETTRHFFAASGAAWDFRAYFNFLAYALLVVCTILAVISNLQVQSRAPKLWTIYISLFGVLSTFIVWLHFLISKTSSIVDQLISVGAGAWVAMLGFACFVVAGLLAP